MAAPSDSPKDPETGQVVDPAVLAERRARREQGEDGGLERAQAAERHAAALEQRLQEADDRLSGAEGDQAALVADLRRAEAALASARQREASGQQLRGELEREASSTRRVLEAEIGRLRAEQAAAEAHGAGLARELEAVRGDAASAQADAHEAAREAGLRHELGELGTLAQELGTTLRTEQDAREEAETALRSARERTTAELGRLQDELDRRTTTQEALAGRMAELRGALDGVRAGAAEAERLGAELAVARTQERELRAQLAALERAAAEATERLAHATAENAAREAALQELQGRLAAREDELRLRHRELAVERAARLAAEQTAAAGESRVAALAVDLEHERVGRGALEALVVAERGRFAAELAGAEDAARATLEHERVLGEARVAEVRLTVDALRGELDAVTRELRRGVAVEQAAREAAERALAEERAARAEDRSAIARDAERLEAQLDAAAGALTDAQEAAAQERGRRAELEAELAERERLEAEVHAALAALREKLEASRRQGEARAERDAAVEELVGELVGTALALRAGFEQELAGLQAEREAERTATATELAGAGQQVAVLRDELAETTRQLQRAPDEAHHQELEREVLRRRAAEERATVALDAVKAELERLRRPGTSIYDTVPSGTVPPGADHPALIRREEPPSADAPPGVVLDLARAAARLRADDEGILADAPPQQAGADATPGAAAAPAARAAGAAPWLGAALAALSELDAGTAERFILSALPVQATRVQRAVTYALELPASGRHLVRVDRGEVQVTAWPDTAVPLDFRLTGGAAALAPLVAGAAPRRLRDVIVRGRRRRLRRLLRSLATPVGLLELERAGVRPRAGDLLSLLCLGVPPEAVRGFDFGVAYVVRDPAGGTSRTLVRAEPDGTLTAIPSAPEAVRADATLTLGANELLGVLGGTERGSVDGDPAVVETLHGWLRTVQGLPG